MPTSLTFLGGAGTVTGSKYLLETGGKRLLIDCGLFQGLKQLRLKNWAPLPAKPSTISAVVLTHAHLDHSGYLPLLIKSGFTGPVYCTEATRDLCSILLPDSGFLNEKDADFANRHGFSKHKLALPLYTKREAQAALRRFRTVPWHDVRQIDGFEFRFHRAGHILGAAIVELRIGATTIVFSGDLGRPGSPTMLPPETVEHADYLVVESTYGDRRHDPRSPENILGEAISRTAARGGTILIASFAVGRAQTLLYHLHRLKSSGAIPNLPLFVDSPMATDATAIYKTHADDQRLTVRQFSAAFSAARYVHDAEESQSLNRNPLPKVIISASGMATGGRILHHLKHYAPDPRNTIVFAGFQAAGTRGATMLAGIDSVKMHGAYVPVRAEIVNLSSMSAHADADELLGWMGGFRAAPKMTYITHGEPAAADGLRRRIEEQLHWPCRIPEHGERTPIQVTKTVTPRNPPRRRRAKV